MTQAVPKDTAGVSVPSSQRMTLIGYTCTKGDGDKRSLTRQRETDTTLRTTGRRSLKPQNGEREITWGRKRRTLQPHCTRRRVEQRGKKWLGQPTEGRERGARSSQRPCPTRDGEKDMGSTPPT